MRCEAPTSAWALSEPLPIGSSGNSRSLVSSPAGPFAHTRVAPSGFAERLLSGGEPSPQEVVDYCAARGIKADIELIRPEQINQAFDRVVSKDVRYRFVIDLAAARKQRA